MGSKLPQMGASVDMAGAVAAIKRGTKRAWLRSAGENAHWRGDIPWELGRKSICLREMGLSRAEGVALARLRTGHSMALRAHAHRVQLAADAGCVDCNQEDDDLQHLFRCPAKAMDLLAVFGRRQLLPGEAFEAQRKVVEFMRRVGRL